MKKLSLLFPIMILLVFSACRKDSEVTMIEEDNHTPIILEGYEPVVENIISSVSGIIVDQTGAPLENVRLSLGNNTSMTDVFGTFRFEDISMNKKGTFLKAEKDGYFMGGRRFYPRVDNKSRIKIELMELDFSESFSSKDGGTINVAGDGGTIVFQPNSIVDNAGTSYEGNVAIATTWLDPTAPQTFSQMPGALQGVNTDNEEVNLITYGMIGVELKGDNGAELNIAEGSTAEIRLKVPLALQSTAPTEIPLWSFNYEYGIWVEEGSAKLENGFYIGAVSHFSFWNCDDFIDLVDFELTIVEEDTQIPLENMQVVINIVSSGASGSGLTNVDGFLSGSIPANEILSVKILSPCGEVLHIVNVGPYTSDAMIGNIAVPSGTNSVTIRGEILGCGANPVSEGMVLVKFGNQFQSYPVSSNPFTIYTAVCPGISEIEIIVGSLESYLQSESITVPVTPIIDIGANAACTEPLLGFFKVTIEGTTRYFQINDTRQLPDTLTPFVNYISFLNQPNVPVGDTLRGQIAFTNSTGIFVTGDYSMANSIDLIHDTENGWLFNNNSGSFDSFTLDEYGPYIGTVISGHMSGTLYNNYGGQSTPVFVEAEFRTLRKQN